MTTATSSEAPPRPDRPRPPRITEIPFELIARRQWVLWRYELNEAGTKWTKIPVKAFDPQRGAKSTDPATWVEFHEAWDAYQLGQGDGIGFVIAEDDPYVGIDLDDCLDGGKPRDWAQPYVAKLRVTYGEVSPSGNGIKFIGKGKLPGKTGGKSLPLGTDGIGTIEAYDHARYFTVTGEVWDIPEIVELGELAAEIYRVVKDRHRVKPATSDGPARSGRVEMPVGNRSAPESRARAYVFAPGFPDAVEGQSGHGRLYHVASVLVDEFGLGRDQAMPIFRDWNAQKAIPPESEKQLDHKLDSAIENHPVPSLKLLNADRSGRRPAGAQPSANNQTQAVADHRPLSSDDNQPRVGIEVNEELDDPHRLARLHFTKCERRLKFFRAEWFGWKYGAHRLIAEAELRSSVTDTVKNEFNRINIIAIQLWGECNAANQGKEASAEADVPQGDKSADIGCDAGPAEHVHLAE